MTHRVLQEITDTSL